MPFDSDEIWEYCGRKFNQPPTEAEMTSESEYEKGYKQGYKDACNDMLKRLDRMRKTTVVCMEEVVQEPKKGVNNERNINCL